MTPHLPPNSSSLVPPHSPPSFVFTGPPSSYDKSFSPKSYNPKPCPPLPPQVVYTGPTPLAIDHFSALGYTSPSATTSIADHMLDVVIKV